MSMYKEYRLQPSIPHQCMHHSEKTGDRCRARAMHNEIMCFQHRADDIPTVLQNDPFELASLYDRAAIQHAITEIAGRLASNHMDLKRAALLLQSCQIATTNLIAHDRAAAKANTAVVPLAPPSAELDPNPDPEALHRDQDRRAELDLDELAVPGPKLAIMSEPPATTPKPVILSERSESKDPDASRSTSTIDAILPTLNASGAPPVVTRSVKDSTKCREASKTARSAEASRTARTAYPRTEMPENVSTTRPRIGTPNALAGWNTYPRS